MEDKVYIIFENDLSTGKKTVRSVYASKTKAKAKVDQLTTANIEDEDLDFTLESYEVIK